MPAKKPMTEDEAIRALKRLAERWPPSLWLFAGGSGSINIMRCSPDGSRADRESDGGSGYDPNACIDSVAIPCDGGDF